MTKENIYDLIKAHATELVDGRFRFKKVDLKEACAELEDCFKRLHKPVFMQAEASASAEGAAVGNSAAGKGVCGGVRNCNGNGIDNGLGYCIYCEEKIPRA